MKPEQREIERLRREVKSWTRLSEQFFWVE